MKQWQRLIHQIRVTGCLVGIAAGASPLYLFCEMLDAALKAVMPFFFILMPKQIIEELMGEQRIQALTEKLLFMVLGYGLLSLADRWVCAQKVTLSQKVRQAFLEKIDERLLTMDYVECMDPEKINHKMRALRPIRNQGAIGGFFDSLSGSLKNALALAGLTGILATLSPLLVVFLLVMVWLHALLQSRMEGCEEEFEGEMAVIDRRYDYYDNLAGEEKRAKDVRLYQMRPFLMDKIREDNTNVLGKYFNQMYRRMGTFAAAAEGVSRLQAAVVCIWMSVCVFLGKITVGAMTMYITSASTFSKSVNAFVSSWLELFKNSRYLEQFLTFVNASQSAGQDAGTQECPERIESVAFEHVWFRYPGTEQYVLQDLTFRVSANEKISVVGENGSGKTTMIRLLCRFYRPERGRILVNDIPVEHFAPASYLSRISAVFQDFALFAFTLEQNLTFDRRREEVAIMELLETVGMKAAVEKLPNGFNTHLFKNFEEDGVNLSGGEMQKLAIARSVYQGNLSHASVLILDEPSSALDPYAEAELYETFGKLSEEKMTFFISHRLSSCRFCDRILVMKDGRLAEMGDHRALLSQNGLYAEMWRAQAQFYQNSV